MRLLRRWGVALAIAALVVIYTAVLVITGEQGGIFWSGVLIPAVFVFSPLFFPRRSRRSDAVGSPEKVAIYFKPADVFSIRLRLALGRVAREALWIDVIADPEAETWVREVNQGDVLTPTVVIGDALKRNPDPHWVGRHLVGPDSTGERPDL